jgi:peptidoglycan DL-endopeptidase CwlO
MSFIVTDVERGKNHSTPRSLWSIGLLRRVGIPALTVVTVFSSTVLGLARPAGGDAITDAKAKAAQIQAELTAAQNQMSALGQAYDAAQYHLGQINSSIATTKANIAADQAQVNKDRTTLAQAAVSNYISDGTAADQNPIFSGNNKTVGAQNEYNQIAEGNINIAVDNLHTAQNELSSQESTLQTEQGQAQAQVQAEQNAINQNAAVVQEQKNALSQEQGQIAQLVQQQQQAEAAAAARAAAAKIAAAQAAAAAAAQQSAGGESSKATLAGDNQAAPPPTAAGGAGAVQAAESQLGVPYVWGGESPKGSASPGFDCSGLTAWSWGQVGVGLPHFSGGQMADSTPVPISDLQPGDLLFYGPGGSDHVAMYVDGGTMIEAPYTGAVVWTTGLRLGNGFVGAGRP